jgi:Tfp pilus assembly protein PilV
MRRRSRGATLVEILISLAVVLVGMLALFRTLAVSVLGSSTSSRLSQAHLRASAIVEAIRSAPKPALDCLRLNTPPNWAGCETTCLAQLGAAAKADSCIFTTATAAQLKGPSATGQVQLPSTDRSGQLYQVVYFANPELGPDGTTRTSQVQTAGLGNLAYDIQVTIGWRDDGTATVSSPAVSGDHFLTLRTAVTP